MPARESICLTKINNVTSTYFKTPCPERPKLYITIHSKVVHLLLLLLHEMLFSHNNIITAVYMDIFFQDPIIGYVFNS